MNLGIRGKRVLVAGGSSGIGKACGLLFLGEEAEVCLVSRSEENLARASDELYGLTSKRAVIVAADLSSSDGPANAVESAVRQLGGVDILINNAGGPKGGTFDTLSDEDWQAAVQLNLMSTVRLTRAALRGMIDQKWGRIVNITSVSVKQPIENLMLSNSVRMSVVGFAKTLSNEISSHGITVNTVAPGFTDTERLKELAGGTATRTGMSVADVYAKWAGEAPAARIGTAAEVASAVVFLSSEPAAYINGVVLPVDGGRIRASM